MNTIEIIIEVLKAVVLGIVEGITEWLPISSTGHMLLVDEFLSLNMSAEFKSMFIYVIQLGAILAVVILYFNKLNPFASKDKTARERRQTWRLWVKIVIACIPSIVIGLPFDDIIEERLHGPYVIAVMLIIYGILFIVVENRQKKLASKDAEGGYKINSLPWIDYKTAFLIGCFQVLSLIPGTSRSGATIIGAMLLGVSRPVAAEFTFFLGIPTMFGVSFLKILKFGLAFTLVEAIVLIVGMIVAFVVSVITIRKLMQYIQKHDFKIFGWYRIVLGLVVLVYFGVINR